MFHIFEFLTQLVISQGGSNCCDDFVDRLNRKYTVILLLVFVTVLSSKQYIGEPLACFCPAHFTGAHVEYTNNICWITKAFYVPVDTSFSWASTTTTTSTTTTSPAFPGMLGLEDLRMQTSNSMSPSSLKFAKVDNLIAYYPFLLIAQAILFYIPYFFWKNIINRSAYDISTLIFIAYDSQYSETQAMREKTLRYLIRHMDRANEYYGTKKKMNRYKTAANNRKLTATTTFTSNPAGSTNLSSWSNLDKRYQKPGHQGQGPNIIDMKGQRDETMNQQNDNNLFEKINKSSSFLRMFENFNFYNLRKRFNLKIFEKSDDDEYGKRGGDEAPSSATSTSSIKAKTKYKNEDDEDDDSDEYKFGPAQHNFNSRMLFTIYMIIKILYILNCVGQFFILNKFIAGETRGASNEDQNPNKNSDNNNPTSHLNNFNDNNNIFSRHGINLNLMHTNNFIDENSAFVRNELTFMIDGSFWKGFEFGYKTIANLIESGNLFGERNRLLIFHRVMFCDFKIRMLGDRLHRHTVQCVLPVNIYTEKMFTVIWFWLLILNFINFYNFFRWLAYYLSYKVRFDFIVKHLLKVNDYVTTSYLNNNNFIQADCTRKSNCFTSVKSKEKAASKSECTFTDDFDDMNISCGKKSNREYANIKLINEMIKTYLMHDNVFIIKLISKNTNEMTTRELVTLLLDNFKRKTRLFDENTV